jgi:GR25 family glycosyltransferase involved in LPS biosynthesis
MINYINYYNMLSKKNIVFLIFTIIIIIIFFIENKYGFSLKDGLKIYFINLKKNRDRWENNKSKLPNFHLFDAIDGSKLSLDKLRKDGFLKEEKKWLGKLGRGGIGCALSHISVINKIKMQNEQYGLILEDDVVIPDNFIEQIKKLEKYFPPTWDIIYLGGCNIRGRKYNNHFLIPEIKSGHNYCCHAILFNKKTINNIINVLNPLQKPIDLQLRSNFNKLKAYFLNPSIFFQNKKLFSNRRFFDNWNQKPNQKLLETQIIE